MPTVHNYIEADVDGDAVIDLQGSHSVRIKGGTNTPNVTGFDGGEDGIELNLHNLSGGSVTVTDQDAAVVALDPSQQIHTTGYGGTFKLPDDQLVWMIKVDPNDAVFPAAKRGWYLDSGGQEIFTRDKAVPSTSAPTNAGALAVVPEMALTSTLIGGHAIAAFSMSLDVHDGDAGTTALYVDGVLIADTVRHIGYTSSKGTLDPDPSFAGTIAFAALLTGLAPGSRVFEVKWTATAGTLRAVGLSRSFNVFEIPA